MLCIQLLLKGKSHRTGKNTPDYPSSEKFVLEWGFFCSNKTDLKNANSEVNALVLHQFIVQTNVLT